MARIFFFNPSPSPAPRVYAILYLLWFSVAIVQLIVLCALRSFLTNITERVGEINLFILIMFNCLFCKKIVEVSSRLDVGRHVRMHIRTLDYPVSKSIKCCQHRCHASYSSLDSFVKHVNKKHSRQCSGAVPVADDCNMLDDDLPDTHNERDVTYLQLSEDNIEDDLAAKCYSDEAMKLILCLVSKSSVTIKRC